MGNSEKRVRFNLPQEHDDWGYKNENVIRKYTQPNNTVIYHYMDPETKKSEPFTGVFYDSYEEGGKLQIEIQMKDGLKNGFYKLYHLDGYILRESYCLNGEDHGEYKWFYPNGQIEELRDYKNGKKNGVWKNFRENGEVDSEVYYEDGEFLEKITIKKDEEPKNVKTQKIKTVSQNKFELSTNEEFQNCISKFSIDYINDLEIEKNKKKGCGVEKIDFYGEYKGSRYTIIGGDEVKWFETEYEEDMNTFIEEVGDEEIYDLENSLSFSFFPSDSYGFYGESIQWAKGTSDNIIKEINDEGSDKLLSECIENGDYDSVDTELNGGDNISSINISFNYNESDISIHWLNKD